MTITSEVVGVILSILALFGSIIGVYVKLNERVTIIETKIKNIPDRAELLTKMDEMKDSIERKMDKMKDEVKTTMKEELSHLKCVDCE